jgi:hypothetical protein
MARIVFPSATMIWFSVPRWPSLNCFRDLADFLGFRLGWGRAFCGKLEHCCFLTFEHVSEKHDLPVWKLQGIMMCLRVVLVDLPEDGSPVIDCIRFPAKPSVLPTPHFFGKGEFRPRKNTNCCLDISSGAANPRVPVLKLWVVSLSPTLAGRDLERFPAELNRGFPIVCE